MYVTASYILEKYSGLSFGEFARKRIFEPLQMNSTVTSEALAPNLSQTWSEKGRRIPLWFSESDMRLLAGAGSILSSTRDMVHFYISYFAYLFMPV